MENRNSFKEITTMKEFWMVRTLDEKMLFTLINNKYNNLFVPTKERNYN